MSVNVEGHEELPLSHLRMFEHICILACKVGGKQVQVYA